MMLFDPSKRQILQINMLLLVSITALFFLAHLINSQPTIMNFDIENVPSSDLSRSLKSEGLFSVIRVALTHTLHEGSHAIGESLAAYPCVIYVGEEFDGRFFGYSESGKEYHKRVLDMFYGYQQLDVQKLVQLLRASRNDSSYKTEVLSNYYACRNDNQAVIVAALGRDSNILARKSALSNSFQYYPIVRKNIMNFALSISKDEKEAMHLSHPQFTKKATLTRHPFSIANLEQSANDVVALWREKVVSATSIIKSKHMSCMNVRFVYYESYLLNSDKFTFDLYQSILRGGGRKTAVAAAVTDPLNISSGHMLVHRVHSDDISLFVENHVEVIKHFNTTPYPSFGQLLKENHWPCSQEEEK